MRINTFGMLHFRDGIGGECALSTRKTAALVTYLAMRPDRRFTRDHLAGLLWGDKDDARARHSLSQAASECRRAFGQNALQVHPQYFCCPSSAFQVDAIELDALARSGRGRDELEAIERLYQGEFLAALELEQDSFECWALAERERFHQIALKAMADLLQLKMRGHELTSALETGRKLLEFEPFDERVHRAIMQCYAYQGTPRQALEHYRAFCSDLKDELGVEPEQETADLFRRILDGDVSKRDGRTPAEFAFVLEQLPYSVVVTDLENKIVGWNHISEHTLGFSKEEMLGQSPTVIYAPDRNSSLADDILVRAIADGRWTGEVRLIKKNGQECRQRRVVTPLFGPDGEMVGAFGHGSPL